MANANTFTSSRDYTKTVTIEVGKTISTIANLHGASIVGIETDGNLTGTTIKFQRSFTQDGTYKEYKTHDLTVIPSTVKSIELGINNADTFGLNATDFAGLQFVKLVSNASQTGSNSVVTLICRGTPA
jgi:hypothetical protein